MPLPLTFLFALFGFSLIYVVYRRYRFYGARLDAERRHAGEIAALHLRTIEALALAIEARDGKPGKAGKDATAHHHLRRVEVYALEIAKELGLTGQDLEALRAAALLHDIGKLAVPEHINSKPGRLSPEEFEKMKIHSAVGAGILDRMQFPYPVAPIVYSHHEKWDGSGYPKGLSGEQIPIGARILSVVDCLDALASDRQYRCALPLDEAIAKIEEGAGKSFDPVVVDVLRRRHAELENMACEEVRATEPPIAGSQSAVAGQAIAAASEAIAAASEESQALFELTQTLGNSLSVDETLSVLALRLRRLIPYDTIAIYVRRENHLTPEYVKGDDFRLFSSLEIPMGQGLSGRVAENGRPVLNGNPSEEIGYLKEPNQFSALRSALSVPLVGVGGVVGAFTLYRAGRDAFTQDHLRVLLAVSAKVALSIENALKYRQVENSAATDYLTDLPNARSLFLHLDGEVARSRRLASPLAVLVCDLDGFKQVNERLGHLEASKLLQKVARALRDQCREYDYIARMGGDEFVAILPGLHSEAVAAKAAQFRLAVEEAGRSIGLGDLLSVSVGEAHFPDDGTDSEQLLTEADRRMYRDKQQNSKRRKSAAIAWEACLPTAAVQ